MRSPIPPYGRVAALVLALALFGPAAPPLAADTVELANGDRLSGRVVRLADGALVLDVPWGGEVSIDVGAVVAVATDEPVTVVLGDGTRLSGRLAPDPAAAREERRLVLTGAALPEPVAVPLAALVALNPLPAGVRLKGSLSGGLVVQSGNTETETLYAEGKLVARGETNRFTLGAQAARAEDGERTTAENARASLQYDHFLSDRWYLAASSTLSHDEFQDLELRTALALSSGYQVLEGERTDLSLELGASYVNEDLITAPDRSFPAARWALDFEHRLAAGRVDLFHGQEGFFGLDGDEKLFVRSRTGARFDLFADFIASAQVALDYDDEPAPGRETTDRTLLVTVGYEW